MKNPFLFLAAMILAGCVTQPAVRTYMPPLSSAPALVPTPAPVSLSESLSPSEQIIDIPQQSPRRKGGELSDQIERLARKTACIPMNGASLIAKTHAVETYQVSCKNGQQQLYKCELRQCRMMH
jgi:hypothetical protein